MGQQKVSGNGERQRQIQKDRYGIAGVNERGSGRGRERRGETRPQQAEPVLLLPEKRGPPAMC